jgi:DNA-binding response OmpR family regulator
VRPAPPPRQDAPLPGNEVVLLVEDDEQVREIASEILKLQGYRVIQASGPSDALQRSMSVAEPIDLLITDLVMPEMNGRALAERLRAQRAGLRVLYVSGYGDNVLQPESALSQGAFLQKPLTPLSLAKAVRAVLDDSA